MLVASQNSIIHEQVGPAQGDFTYREAIPANARIWSPCGASTPLNINNAVIIRKPGGGDNYVNARSVVTGIQWRNC